MAETKTVKVSVKTVKKEVDKKVSVLKEKEVSIPETAECDPTLATKKKILFVYIM